MNKLNRNTANVNASKNGYKKNKYLIKYIGGIILFLLTITTYHFLIPSISHKSREYFQHTNIYSNFIVGDHISETVHIQDENDQLLSILQIEKPTLVVKYSELSCNVCVDSVLIGLSRYVRDEINITYISDYTVKRHLHIFKRINKIDNTIYRCNFHNQLDKRRLVYLFVLDKDLIYKNVYIPDKNNIKELEAYIEIIKNKYFDENTAVH